VLQRKKESRVASEYPRGECVFVEGDGPAARRGRRIILDPEQKPGGREHRRHRGRDAGLERAARCGDRPLAHRHEPGDCLVVGRPAKGPLGETPDRAPQVIGPGRRIRGPGAEREQAAEVGRIAVGRDDRRGGHAVADPSRQVDILFQQQRRDRQHLADRVEAVAGVVGRQVVPQVFLAAGQVADGVGIFHAIEPPQHHVARVGPPGIDAQHVPGHELEHPSPFGGRRLRLVGRGHRLGPEVFPEIHPAGMLRRASIDRAASDGGREHPVDGHAPFLGAGEVTGPTEAGEDLLRRVVSRGGSRPQRRHHEARAESGLPHPVEPRRHGSSSGRHNRNSR